jgi:hypothetical protein
MIVKKHSERRHDMADKQPAASAQRSDWITRKFILTDMPTGLMLTLVAVGLPRTVLADLGIVAPESSLLYYFLALTPFAIWLAVAILRTSRRPFMDFLVLGVTNLQPPPSTSPTRSVRPSTTSRCGHTRS